VKHSLTKLSKLLKPEALKTSRFSRANLAVFAVIFASIGGYLIYSSFAAGNTYYMSPAGSGTACTQVNPCSSFNAAYATATLGDTVQLANGNYATQDFSGTKSGSGQVKFIPASGATINVSGEFNIYGNHADFDGLKTGDWYVRSGANDIILRNSHSGGWYAIRDATNIQVIKGDLGGGKDVTPQITGSTNVTIDGVNFHDWLCTNSDCSPVTGTDKPHVDCLGLFGGNTSLIIRNSNFTNCQHYDILVDNSTNTNYNSAVTLENNIFGATVTGIPNMLVARCTSCVVRNNDFIANGFSLDKDVAGSVTGLQVYSNIFPQMNNLYCPVATFSYNLYISGSTCGGTGEKVGSSGFVNEGVGNYHLASTSTAIDSGNPTSFPTTDIDGDTRPQGLAPDAGADEYIGTITPPSPTPPPPTPPTPPPGPPSNLLLGKPERGNKS
jgi:hypothetical protein